MSVKAATTSTGHIRKILLIVLLMFFITGILVAWLATSGEFTRVVFQYAVDRAGENAGTSIEHEGLSGNFWDGISLSNLKIRKSHPPFQLNAADATIRPDFSNLKSGVIAVSVSAGEINVDGMTSAPLASSTIPDYHGMACFSGIPANVRIASLEIEKINVRPFNDFPAAVSLNGLKMTAPDNSGRQSININIDGQWRNNTVASGAFAGFFRQAEAKIEGSLNLNAAGQTLVSELNLQNRRGAMEASGFISSAAIDISHLSHWLIPIWQQEFPVGFDGHLSCSGSWMFSPKLGFMGNLAGDVRNLRAVALGLFISVFELNGRWKFFDGHFSFDDSASRFFGFPASLTGKIESVFSSDRRFDMNFFCNSIDFANLYNELPWGAKYGMAIPRLAGNATFSLQLSGKRPEVDTRLLIARLDAGNDSELRHVDGSISYNLPAKGPGKFLTRMQCHTNNADLPFFRRFKGPYGSMKNRVVELNRPLIFSYVMAGNDFSTLRLSGELVSADQCVARATGTWHDGMGAAAFLWNIDSNREPQSFAAGNIPFLELILAK